MKRLLESIKDMKSSDVKNAIDMRMQEFKELGSKSDEELFKELCFCLMTANFNAERSIRIQQEIGDGFLHLPESKLAGRLAELGHRFPNMRASFIVEARKHKESLRLADREWLVKNVRGLGYKEASHFLRNTGKTDVSIIDFHIVDLLVANKLIKNPKSLTKVNYLQIEGLLKQIAWKSELNLAELDLYLWSMETGKVLK